jgi:hypothetical protein
MVAGVNVGGDICQEPAASIFAMFRTQGILSHKSVRLMSATRGCKLETVLVAGRGVGVAAM